MKKLLALILVLGLLSTCFGALAEDLYAGEKVKLEMAVWNSVETYEKINAALIERFPRLARRPTSKSSSKATAMWAWPRRCACCWAPRRPCRTWSA